MARDATTPRRSCAAPACRPRTPDPLDDLARPRPEPNEHGERGEAGDEQRQQCSGEPGQQEAREQSSGGRARGRMAWEPCSWWSRRRRRRISTFTSTSDSACRWSGNGRRTRLPGAAERGRRSMPAPPPRTPPRSCRRSPLPAARARPGANAFERSPTVKIRTCCARAFAITLSSSLRLPMSAPSESSTIEPAESSRAVEQRERPRQRVVDARPECDAGGPRERRVSWRRRAGAPEHADSSRRTRPADLLAGRRWATNAARRGGAPRGAPFMLRLVSIASTVP